MQANGLEKNKMQTRSSAVALSCEIGIRGRSRSLEIVPKSRADTSILEFCTNSVSISYGLWDITAYLCDITTLTTFQHPSPVNVSMFVSTYMYYTVVVVATTTITTIPTTTTTIQQAL